MTRLFKGLFGKVRSRESNTKRFNWQKIEGACHCQTAQIAPLVDLCDPLYIASWKEIENVTCCAIPIPALIGNAIHEKTFKLNNPWSEGMLNIWCKLMRKYKDPILPITWIAYDPKFVPNATDGKFKHWVKQGLLIYDNLLDKNGKVKTFQSLRETYDQDKKDFYGFLQIRHYLENTKKHSLIFQLNC